MIDALLYLMDDLESVQARFDTLGHDRNHCEVEDTAVAILRFRRGTLGVIEATTCAFNDFNDLIEVHAMKGSAALTGGKLTQWQLRDEPDFQFDPADYEPERREEFHGHRLLYREVVPYFADGAPCRCEIRTGRRAIALIEAIYTSARQDGAVVHAVL